MENLITTVQKHEREYPAPVFLGFLLKERWSLLDGKHEAWHNSNHERLAEICSTGDCNLKRPDGWIQRWDFNRASCWNTIAGAEACAPEGERDRYVLYAYRAVPIVFDNEGDPCEISPDELFDIGLPPLPPEPDMPEFVSLGFDVVEYCGFLNYGCSPLSCNGMHNDYPVNQFCLLPDMNSAYTAAKAFGIEEPEPGPYIIIEVLRHLDYKTSLSDSSMELK